MKPNIDIVIDCTAPEGLADFWAAALGYDKVGWFDPYFLLVSPTPGLPSVVLQHVPEPKAGKARVHFDIRADDVDSEAERLERLGAVRVDIGQQGDEAWIPMADPEGNEFCVCPGVPLPSSHTRNSGNSVDEVLSAARDCLDRVTPEALATERANGALIVDIRPAEQRVRDGELPGAVVIERNTLEWRLDPRSDYRVPEIAGLDTRIVIVCNEGYGSSLAAASLQELGLHRATDMVGGFQAWLAESILSSGDPPVNEPVSRDEREALARFSKRYAVPTAEVSGQIERRVIGADWGANGYTTVEQADELGRRVHLGPGHTLLDVGTGRGWPGLYLAKTTGCSLVGTDMPIDALTAAAVRARAEGIDDRVSLLAASGALQPFRSESFDAVIHTDVLC